MSRSKACPKNLNMHRIVVCFIHKHSTTFIFNITLSVSIVSRQLLDGYNNIHRMEHHGDNSINTEYHYG